MRSAGAAERLYGRSIRRNGCLIWTGCRFAEGYGRIAYRGRVWLTHRLSLFLNTGEEANGRLVLHSCDNPACVEPSHLRYGTNQDNADDKMARSEERRV